MSRDSLQPSSREKAGLFQRRPSPPGLLDVVRVRRAIPQHGIKVGDEGTVVEVLTSPEGYLVDFSYEPGYDTHELPVYGLTADQLEVVRRHRDAPAS